MDPQRRPVGPFGAACEPQEPGEDSTGTGTIVAGLLWFASRPKWPDKATMQIHAWRSVFVAGMALCFFWALARLPMAEAIALAFVAPLTNVPQPVRQRTALYAPSSIDSPFISTSIAEKVAIPAQAIRKGMTGEGESGRMVAP